MMNVRVETETSVRAELRARMGRSAVVAAFSALVSELAHACGGGMTHPIAAVGLVTALLVLPTFAVMRTARRSWIFALTALEQLAMHQFWSMLDAPVAERTVHAHHGGTQVLHAMAGMHHAMSPGRMLLAHAAATVLTCYLATRAERDLWHALWAWLGRIPQRQPLQLLPRHEVAAVVLCRPELLRPRTLRGRAPPAVLA